MWGDVIALPLGASQRRLGSSVSRCPHVCQCMCCKRPRPSTADELLACTAAVLRLLACAVGLHCGRASHAICFVLARLLSHTVILVFCLAVH